MSDNKSKITEAAVAKVRDQCRSKHIVSKRSALSAQIALRKTYLQLDKPATIRTIRADIALKIGACAG